MEGFVRAIPRSLVPASLKSPADFIYRGGFTIELREYSREWYAYALESSKPEESFFAIRHGNYNPVEHQDLSEMVLELLEF